MPEEDNQTVASPLSDENVSAAPVTEPAADVAAVEVVADDAVADPEIQPELPLGAAEVLPSEQPPESIATESENITSGQAAEPPVASMTVEASADAPSQAAVPAAPQEPAITPLVAAPARLDPARVISMIIVLLVILAVVFYATRKPAAQIPSDSGPSVTVSSSQEQGKINIIEETKNDILVSGGAETAYPQVKVIAYFGNPQKGGGSSDCALAYPLERTIDKRYDSDMINSVLGLLQPLTSAEKESGYFSAIPSGTSLKYLKLDDSGVMYVNLSGNISKAAGSCAVTAIRSEISQTVSQFASVKSVVICVDGECRADRVLQP